MSGPPQARGVPPEEIRAAESERDVDVLAVHRHAFREAGDPGEGAENGPWWFWAAAVAALVFGGYYMGRYGGAFTGEAAVHAQPAALQHGTAAPGAAQEPVDGGAVFSGRCAACHQATGLGLPGAFPPLAGSEYVNGDPARLARLVLRGLTGPVTVAGAQFNGAMPAWADQLKDGEVAAVLTYVRSHFGNSAGPVSKDIVAEARAATASRTTPWTIVELK
ncbi:MAG TPA: cytochrome c [Gemmatimonadales bacterium]|nr:cytochrome c [Gemmatimonadales bacterium]